MNKELQKLNRIRKRNALAEKIFLAACSDGKYWEVHPNSMNNLLQMVFDAADIFIKYSEKIDCYEFG